MNEDKGDKVFGCAILVLALVLLSAFVPFIIGLWKWALR